MKDFVNLGTGILVVKNKKILLGKRLGNTYLSGSFGVPGGRVKLGESLMESAKRELREETGLEPKKLELVGLVNDNRRQKTFIHIVFICLEFEGEPQNIEPDKCERWQWFNFEKLPKNILPGHKAGIEIYLENRRLEEIF